MDEIRLWRELKHNYSYGAYELHKFHVMITHKSRIHLFSRECHYYIKKGMNELQGRGRKQQFFCIFLPPSKNRFIQRFSLYDNFRSHSTNENVVKSMRNENDIFSLHSLRSERGKYFHSTDNGFKSTVIICNFSNFHTLMNIKDWQFSERHCWIHQKYYLYNEV